MYDSGEVDVRMDNKKLITLLCISIFIVIMTTAGVTYAYLSLSAVQTTPNVINTACFEVGFNPLSVFSPISYPMSSTTAFNKTPYSFTISKGNSCETNINYKIYLNVMDGSTLDTSYIKYSLDKTTVNGLNSTVDLPVGADKAGVKSSYLVGEGTLTSASETKNLYVWIDESAGNEIMGQEFKTQILVYSEPISS